MRILSLLKTTFILLALYSARLSAEPVIEIDVENDLVRIDPRGETASQVLISLATKAGFEMTGKLESEQVALNNEMQGSLKDIVNTLARPQSVAIIYSRDQKGKQYIRKVELLQTGTEDTKYMPNAEDAYMPLEGTQEQIERRIKNNERRASKRTKKIEEGTLISMPEGRRMLEEKAKRLREQQDQQQLLLQKQQGE